MVDRIDEVRIMLISTEPSGRTEVRSAIGSTMRVKMTRFDRPADLRGFEDAVVDGEDAGADRVRRIGAAGDRQRDHAGGEGVDVNADLGQPVIEEEQLHDERDVAEQVDIEEGQPAAPTWLDEVRAMATSMPRMTLPTSARAQTSSGQ